MKERSPYYDYALPEGWRDPRDPSDFTDREQMEIEETLELLQNNEAELEDLDMLPLKIKEEILRRLR